MTAAPLTYPTSAGTEPPLFLPPAGDFCQQRQKSPKTPLETAFQDFLTRVGYDFALTCPTRNFTARVPVDIPSRRTTLSARTHTPCRAGPACPAAGMRFPSAGRCGHRPLRRDRRACRITNVGDGVRDVPSARQCRAARPPLGGGCRRSRLGERKPCGISPSASASRCHLPRRGRQGGSASPCAAGHMGPALRQGTASRSFPSLRHFSS